MSSWDEIAISFAISDESLNQMYESLREASESMRQFDNSFSSIGQIFHTRVQEELIARQQQHSQRLRDYQGSWDSVYWCDSTPREVPYFHRKKYDWQPQRRAKKLLMSVLTKGQKKEYKRTNSFLVKSQLGNTYRITPMSAYNVLFSDEQGEIIKAYCLTTSNLEDVPIEDNMVVQKLLLESNEEHFLKVANVKESNLSNSYWFQGVNEMFGTAKPVTTSLETFGNCYWTDFGSFVTFRYVDWSQ